MTEQLPDGSDLGHRFNYIRNSVKAVVDAYDGTVTFYVVDPTDPLIRAYQKAFPELFTDESQMTETLRAHLRYPEDLFRVQTTMWARYHIEDVRRVLQPERRVERGAGSGHGRRHREHHADDRRGGPCGSREPSSASIPTTC